MLDESSNLSTSKRNAYDILSKKNSYLYTKDMERFLNKVNKTDSCWLWTGAVRGKCGYGAITISGKTISAHRLSYELFKEKIPDNMLVCHTCDVRLCVNPDHLFLGTYADNMRDCVAKSRNYIPTENRFVKGHKPTNALLSDEEVLFVKEALKNRKVSIKVLSEEIKYPYQLLRDINCGRIYKT